MARASSLVLGCLGYFVDGALGLGKQLLWVDLVRANGGMLHLHDWESTAQKEDIGIWGAPDLKDRVSMGDKVKGL